jgi:hypothetical protein
MVRISVFVFGAIRLIYLDVVTWNRMLSFPVVFYEACSGLGCFVRVSGAEDLLRRPVGYMSASLKLSRGQGMPLNDCE